jgi:uncharacterized protein (UPF0276 family)
MSSRGKSIKDNTQPGLTFGVGLRKPHFDEIFSNHQGVDFLEILSDNFMGLGGRERSVLERAKEAFPIILHGVSLSIGSPDPLCEDYLKHLKNLIDWVKPTFFSDHLCFSSAFGVEYHDLIPLPFTGDAVRHIVPRIEKVKAISDVPFLLENPSYYVEMPGAEMREDEFILEILEKSNCGLLLDVNNVYVNAQNHGYDPQAFIDHIPQERVYQYHIAGHYRRDDVIIDTHGDHVSDPVLELFKYTIQKIGPRPTLLEWDNDIPSLDVLLMENLKVRNAAQSVTKELLLKSAAVEI